MISAPVDPSCQGTQRFRSCFSTWMPCIWHAERFVSHVQGRFQMLEAVEDSRMAFLEIV